MKPITYLTMKPEGNKITDSLVFSENLLQFTSKHNNITYCTNQTTGTFPDPFTGEEVNASEGRPLEDNELLSSLKTDDTMGIENHLLSKLKPGIGKSVECKFDDGSTALVVASAEDTDQIIKIGKLYCSNGSATKNLFEEATEASENKVDPASNTDTTTSSNDSALTAEVVEKLSDADAKDLLSTIIASITDEEVKSESVELANINDSKIILKALAENKEDIVESDEKKKKKVKNFLKKAGAAVAGPSYLAWQHQKDKQEKEAKKDKVKSSDETSSETDENTSDIKIFKDTGEGNTPIQLSAWKPSIGEDGDYRLKQVKAFNLADDSNKLSEGDRIAFTRNYFEAETPEMLMAFRVDKVDPDNSEQLIISAVNVDEVLSKGATAKFKAWVASRMGSIFTDYIKELEKAYKEDSSPTGKAKAYQLAESFAEKQWNELVAQVPQEKRTVQFMARKKKIEAANRKIVDNLWAQKEISSWDAFRRMAKAQLLGIIAVDLFYTWMFGFGVTTIGMNSLTKQAMKLGKLAGIKASTTDEIQSSVDNLSDSDYEVFESNVKHLFDEITFDAEFGPVLGWDYGTLEANAKDKKLVLNWTKSILDPLNDEFEKRLAQHVVNKDDTSIRNLVNTTADKAFDAIVAEIPEAERKNPKLLSLKNDLVSAYKKAGDAAKARASGKVRKIASSVFWASLLAAKAAWWAPLYLGVSLYHGITWGNKNQIKSSTDLTVTQMNRMNDIESLKEEAKLLESKELKNQYRYQAAQIESTYRNAIIKQNEKFAGGADQFEINASIEEFNTLEASIDEQIAQTRDNMYDAVLEDIMTHSSEYIDNSPKVVEAFTKYVDNYLAFGGENVQASAMLEDDLDALTAMIMEPVEAKIGKAAKAVTDAVSKRGAKIGQSVKQQATKHAGKAKNVVKKAYNATKKAIVKYAKKVKKKGGEYWKKIKNAAGGAKKRLKGAYYQATNPLRKKMGKSTRTSTGKVRGRPKGSKKPKAEPKSSKPTKLYDPTTGKKVKKPEQGKAYLTERPKRSEGGSEKVGKSKRKRTPPGTRRGGSAKKGKQAKRSERKRTRMTNKTIESTIASVLTDDIVATVAEKFNEIAISNTEGRNDFLKKWGQQLVTSAVKTYAEAEETSTVTVADQVKDPNINFTALDQQTFGVWADQGKTLVAKINNTVPMFQLLASQTGIPANVIAEINNGIKTNGLSHALKQMGAEEVTFNISANQQGQVEKQKKDLEIKASEAATNKVNWFKRCMEVASILGPTDTFKDVNPDGNILSRDLEQALTAYNIVTASADAAKFVNSTGLKSTRAMINIADYLSANCSEEQLKTYEDLCSKVNPDALTASYSTQSNPNQTQNTASTQVDLNQQNPNPGQQNPIQIQTQPIQSNVQQPNQSVFQTVPVVHQQNAQPIQSNTDPNQGQNQTIQVTQQPQVQNQQPTQQFDPNQNNQVNLNQGIQYQQPVQVQQQPVQSNVQFQYQQPAQQQTQVVQNQQNQNPIQSAVNNSLQNSMGPAQPQQNVQYQQPIQFNQQQPVQNQQYNWNGQQPPAPILSTNQPILNNLTGDNIDQTLQASMF